MNVLVLLATLSLGTGFSAASQESMTLGSLTRARALFDRIDADRDESLSVEEATLVGIPEEHFHGEDADSDECFSRDEFSVYYFHLLVAAAEDVEADLVDEVALLHALKLSQRSEVSDVEADQANPVSELALEGAPSGERGASGAVLPRKTNSLTRARKLLVRLSAEAAFSKAVTHDFRAFFWGRAPRGMGLEQSVPALVRVKAEIDDMLESAFVTEKEARLLRKTLAHRAGPAAARAASEAGESVVKMNETDPESDGPQMEPSNGDAVGSAPLTIPDFDVTRIEVHSAGNRVDANFIGPLELGSVRIGRQQAAMATALPFFLRLAFPADLEGFSSFLAGPNAGSVPLVATDPMPTDLMPTDLMPTDLMPTDPMPTDPVRTEDGTSPTPESHDDQDLEPRMISSVPVGLPAVQVQVEQQSEASVAETADVPFFIPSTRPSVYSFSDDGVAPGSPTGRPETR